MDTEGFVGWALDNSRTIEERYTVELLVEELVRHWHAKNKTGKHESWEIQHERNRSVNSIPLTNRFIPKKACGAPPKSFRRKLIGITALTKPGPFAISKRYAFCLPSNISSSTSKRPIFLRSWICHACASSPSAAGFAKITARSPVALLCANLL